MSVHGIAMHLVDLNNWCHFWKKDFEEAISEIKVMVQKEQDSERAMVLKGLSPRQSKRKVYDAVCPNCGAQLYTIEDLHGEIGSSECSLEELRRFSSSLDQKLDSGRGRFCDKCGQKLKIK